MDELLQQIQSACAGLSAEEIEGQIAASQYAGSIEDIPTLARFLEAVGAAGTIDNPVTGEPEQAMTPDQSGND
jgi:hypothetical protein